MLAVVDRHYGILMLLPSIVVYFLCIGYAAYYSYVPDVFGLILPLLPVFIGGGLLVFLYYTYSILKRKNSDLDKAVTESITQFKKNISNLQQSISPEAQRPESQESGGKKQNEVQNT